MKLGIFMMPVHPLHRDPTVTLREDRETVMLADQLGYDLVGHRLELYAVPRRGKQEPDQG